MSNHWFSYVGYGISVYEVRHASMEGIRELAKHCTSHNQKLVAECDTVEEINDTVFDVDAEEYGVPALLVDAIFLEHKIPVILASADDEPCILYEPSYPWQTYYEGEKDLTEEKLEQIFIKYMDILGIPKNEQPTPEYKTLIGYC